MSLSKEEKLKLCSGCHSDFYNGLNPYNIKECWSLANAKPVMKKKVPMSLVPPWNMSPIKVLDCCHYDGYALVDPKVNC